MQMNSFGRRRRGEGFQPRPQGAFPWLWEGKGREKRPGDEVGAVRKMFFVPHFRNQTLKGRFLN